MDKKTLFIVILVSGFLLLNNSNTNTGTALKRQKLIALVNSGGDSAETKQRVTALFQSIMTDTEINVVYAVLIEKKPPTSTFYAIGEKYNIFT